MGFIGDLKTKKLVRAVQKYPSVFEKHESLIRELRRTGRRREVQEAVQQAMNHSWPPDQKAWLNLQEILATLDNNRPDTAMDRLVPLLENQDMGASIRAEIAMESGHILLEEYRHGNPQPSVWAAIRPVLHDLLSSDPKSPHVFDAGMLLAGLEKISGDIPAARNTFELLIGIHERIGFKGMGAVYLEAAALSEQLQDDSQTALRYYMQALDSEELSDASLAETLTRMGLILKKNEDFLGAMDKFETAIRFAGELDDIQTAALRFELADVYLRLGRIAQALRESEKSLKSPELDPENEVRILLWRSQIHISQERLNSAAQEMERASKLPAPAALKSRISEISAQISMSRKDPGKAAAQLQDAINLRNNEPDHELQLKLAKALNAAEQPHQALRIINRLREEQATLTFHPAEIDLCEAEAFRMQKKIVKSLECYLKIIESEPENQPVYQQARQAVHRLKKQLETEPGRRYFKIDGPDRKALASLLARSPGDDVMSRLKRGLAKTKSSLVGNIEKLLGERKDITSEILDDLEELLLLSDIGVTTTMRIMNGLRDKLRKNEIRDACFVRGFIRSEIESILNYGSIDTLWEDHDPPHIIMVVGVNGVGKTTTIAKLARHYRDQGKTVFLAAGDTFRAGAIQQLQEWGKRVNAEVISQAEGSDPSAVAWDAVAAAKSRHADILIIDTAGRLHTQFNLMEELKKVHRVVGKNMPGAPHEILLVLDATTGQNAVAQARLFSEAVRVTGIALTKLDGTAKGGIVISIVNDLKLPVRYIGIGERMDDLRDFDPRTFAAALFED